MKWLCYLLVALTSVVAYAENGWVSLNAEDNKHCSEAKPCYLKQKNAKSSFKIVLGTKKEGNKLELQNVTITGDTTGLFSTLANFPIHFETEKYELFATDLNSDGYQDIALQASRSLKDGFNYYYWIYDPKEKNFVQTEEQLEALAPFGKSKLKAKSSGTIYIVNASHKIVPDQTKKK